MISIGLLAGVEIVDVLSEKFAEVVDQHLDEQRFLLGCEMKRKTEDFIDKIWTMTFEMIRKMDPVRFRSRVQKITIYVLEKTQASEERMLRLYGICVEQYLAEFEKLDKHCLQQIAAPSDPRQRIAMLLHYQATYISRRHKVDQVINNHHEKNIQRLRECAAAILKKELQVSTH